MYDELTKSLRDCAEVNSLSLYKRGLMKQAADTIEELSAKVESLQIFVDNISKLPDCNTCLKKNLCEFMPKYGEYCRINCPAWLGEPQTQKEE